LLSFSWLLRMMFSNNIESELQIVSKLDNKDMQRLL
jgi:hypothetical protein